MAGFIGELLFAIVRGLVADWAYALFVKVGTRLDGKIAGRTWKVVVGMGLGIAAYFLIPVLIGLLGL